ncbi:hypothetical protein KEM52_006472 [Ascosphaera acerosa]|nr:hypothetical protein KEM52_006472 [Ascosphaera acerosa]
MPRKSPEPAVQASSAPLADFFWIAGVDSAELYETFKRLGEEYHLHHALAVNGTAANRLSVESSTGSRSARTSSLLQNPSENIIEEDADAEEKEQETGSSYDVAALAGNHRSSTGTTYRLGPARQPSESRLSYRSNTSGHLRDGHEDGSHSNRSSMTVKEQVVTTSPFPETSGNASVRTSYTTGSAATTTFMSDDEFDKALLKFASDRDSFLNDLSLSTPTSASAVMSKLNSTPNTKTSTATLARSSTVINIHATNNSSTTVTGHSGAATSNGPATPKWSRLAQRIIPEEPVSSNPLKSGIGSVRKHMSFRDMSSVKRQPSLARQVSVRTSRRLSNYNSVIPVPQPLNASPDMHPLKRKFEPALLDRYPPKAHVEDEDVARARGTFPDYVPMFAFPNDINIVSSDVRPRSTWHGFAMTGGDGAKIYSVCVTVWIPLNSSTAEELEKRCEEWRRDNMTGEERELAASLGERLARERAKLSELLAELPNVPQGSSQRDKLEDDISSVEEKIALMADLLRPVRHAAASKIQGLTDGETGFWIPRAYGLMGRDASLIQFWKDYLRALVVPMSEGAVLRVPFISPRSGRWMPLERYIVNICTEACAPVGSSTQVELAVRELRLFARKEAKNELPGARSTDLYALFRALSIPNIIVLFEYALSESRIIFLSNTQGRSGGSTPTGGGTAESGQPQFQLPSDDFVLVDLDNDIIEGTTRPNCLPRHQRRKLQNLLHAAAPLHTKFQVRPGPPAYAIETFPFDAFCVDNPSIFSSRPQSTHLAKLVSLNSASYGANTASLAGGSSRTALQPPPVYNAFLNARADVSLNSATRTPSTISMTPTNRSFYNNFRNYYGNGLQDNRPGTAQSLMDQLGRSGTPSSPVSSTHHSPTYFNSANGTPLVSSLARNDSGFSFHATLREKRSCHFDSASKRSGGNGSVGSSAGGSMTRRPSVPMLGHASNLSVSSSMDTKGSYTPSLYAPSSFAASTIAASTIMAGGNGGGSIRSFAMGGGRSGAPNGAVFIEGHCLMPRPSGAADMQIPCLICDEKPGDSEYMPVSENVYTCTGCGTIVHDRCANQISCVCPAAFHPEQIRAAFVRCFASLLYTYKKYMRVASGDKRRAGMAYSFNWEGWIKSLPADHAEYISGTLQNTQAFSEFISEREHATPGGPGNAEKDPKITLFDEIILSKRNRGRTSIFGSRLVTSFLSDTTDHVWKTVTPASASGSNMDIPGLEHQTITLSDGRTVDWREMVTRIPAKLDPFLIANLGTHAATDTKSLQTPATHTAEKKDPKHGQACR